LTLFILPFLIVVLPILEIFILFNAGIPWYLAVIFGVVFVILNAGILGLFILTLGITVAISPDIPRARMVLFAAGATIFLLTRLVTAWQSFAHAAS
jgi:hypothetical protein